MSEDWRFERSRKADIRKAVKVRKMRQRIRADKRTLSERLNIANMY